MTGSSKTSKEQGGNWSNPMPANADLEEAVRLQIAELRSALAPQCLCGRKMFNISPKGEPAEYMCIICG